jgi:hypothetical protein
MLSCEGRMAYMGAEMNVVVQVRIELYDVRRTKFVQAHSTSLACLALSLDGKLLATASERGTLVRVFNTSDGTKLQVLSSQIENNGHSASVRM